MMRPRVVSENGLALIRHFEGFVPHIYQDAAGIATIGYGHVLRPGENAAFENGIEKQAAEKLLMQDVAIAARAVMRFITLPLQQHQFDALCSFTFNLGAGALQRSTLRQVVNRGEHLAVPRELMRWVWAGGRRLPGLTHRRQAEGALYFSGQSSEFSGQ